MLAFFKFPEWLPLILDLVETPEVEAVEVHSPELTQSWNPLSPDSGCSGSPGIPE